MDEELTVTTLRNKQIAILKARNCYRRGRDLCFSGSALWRGAVGVTMSCRTKGIALRIYDCWTHDNVNILVRQQGVCCDFVG